MCVWVGVFVCILLQKTVIGTMGEKLGRQFLVEEWNEWAVLGESELIPFSCKDFHIPFMCQILFGHW